MPSLKADDCPVDTSAIFDVEDTLVGEESPTSSNDAEAIASSDNHDHHGSAAVATTASFDIHGKETLLTSTGSCWICHSTEHKESKCPNAEDDKYDGNFEKKLGLGLGLGHHGHSLERRKPLVVDHYISMLWCGRGYLPGCSIILPVMLYYVNI